MLEDRVDKPVRRAKAAASPSRYVEARAEVEPGAPEPELSGDGFSYRHNWGPRRGQAVLRLNWGDVGPRSHVFVSIGEGGAGGPDAGKFVGAARYTLHNVAPRPGGVDIWVNVEWGSDILLHADYLVVNPPGFRTVQVVVHRHNAVALTDADADRILGAMGAVLRSADTPGDTATPVQFVRNGPVRLLPATVAGTIQTEAEWNTLMAAGTGVKVVQAIRWCGGPGGSIIGCAPVGSATTNLAVVRFAADQEGVLWAHEYGHNAGLPHRTDDARAVMFPSIGADHNVVNAVESGRYMAGPLAGTGAPMASGCAACGGDMVEPPEDVREFVSRHWIEGVPYEAASRYSEKDAERLIEWLREPHAHEEFLPEIVTTLCFIGSEAAVAPLIDFVEGPLTGQAAFNAKNAALIHLGDLVNKTGDRTALEFLMRVAGDMEAARSIAEPQASAAAAGSDAASPTPDALAAELAVSATFGLSLAGAPEAVSAVERLTVDADAFASVNQAAAEAVEIARTVSAEGLEAYYGTKAGRGSGR